MEGAVSHLISGDGQVVEDHGEDSGAAFHCVLGAFLDADSRRGRGSAVRAHALPLRLRLVSRVRNLSGLEAASSTRARIIDVAAHAPQ